MFRCALPQPPPPPPPPPKDDKRGGGGQGTRDERPLFEALYVVSVEGGVPEDDTIPPRSSVEAYERANRRSQPRVIWRCVVIVIIGSCIRGVVG